VGITHYVRQLWLGATARTSKDYWERRYKLGMTSGPGSYGALAAYKARVLNAFVETRAVTSIIELGCGDGNQLALANYPRYLGLDVSQRAVDTCIDRFRADVSKSFLWYDSAHASNVANFLRADLVLSLDVIYHLLEDDAYHRYMTDLFSMSDRFVIIYSSDREEHHPAAHVRHRKFTTLVSNQFSEFRLTEHQGNPHAGETFAEFFVYERGLNNVLGNRPSAIVDS